MSGSRNAIQHLGPAEVEALVRQGEATLVDVREPAEFAAERIAGAVLMPLSRFDPASLPEGAVVFTCGSGKRSLTAIAHCRAAGLPHESHLAGGLAAWKQAGLGTER